jgi:hypothetical protein
MKLMQTPSVHVRYVRVELVILPDPGHAASRCATGW